MITLSLLPTEPDTLAKFRRPKVFEFGVLLWMKASCKIACSTDFHELNPVNRRIVWYGWLYYEREHLRLNHICLTETHGTGGDALSDGELSLSSLLYRNVKVHSVPVPEQWAWHTKHKGSRLFCCIWHH